jgi:hypothetical protein
MADPIQPDDLHDLVKTTLRRLGKLKFTELTTDRVRHVAYDNLIRKNKMEVGGGYGIQFDVMIDHNNSAQFTGLGAQDTVAQVEVMTQGNIPYRRLTANFSVIGEELDMNAEPERIVRLIQTRRLGALISMVEKIEDRFWKVPVSTDKVLPYGLPYWIVKTSNTTGLFVTTPPSGYTLVGGLDPVNDCKGRWANWGCQYTNVTKDDLIAKWWEAAERTDFMPPVDGIPQFDTGEGYGFYINLALKLSLKKILEAQNENLGSDLDATNNTMTFRQTPITRAPQLDDDTTNPVYGIFWGNFFIASLRNWWMRETKVEVYPGQHTMAVTFYDCSLNPATRNRRRHFVLATGTTLP